MHYFLCVQQNCDFSITTSPEGKKLTRIDIPHPSKKGEIEDGRQDGLGYQYCTISSIILHIKSIFMSPHTCWDHKIICNVFLNKIYSAK